MESPEEQVTEDVTRRVNLGRHQMVATKARFAAICARIEDPESQPAELCRLIAFEIAMVAKSMRSRGFTTGDGYFIRGYAKEVKALRELGKQLLQAEAWRRKEDIFAFEGEKFQFVLGRIVELFVKAMKEAGVPDDLRASVMRHYRDLMAENAPLIRRETKELGANKTS